MTCDICGQPRLDDEMILLEGRSVCAACKPAFIQQLKEGCLPPVAPAIPVGFDERMFGPWELVTLSWRFFRQDWLAISALIVLVSIPINLVLAAVTPVDDASFRETVRHFKLSQSLETFFGVLAPLSIARIVGDRLQGRAIGFGGGLLHGLRRWLPAMGTGIVEGLIVGLLTLALVIPGIIWTVYYTFSTVVVSLRGCAGKSALDYSKALVRGRWWAILGRTLLLALMAILPDIAVEIGATFAPESPVITLVGAVITDVCLSFVVVGLTLLFLNLDAIQQRLPTPAFSSLRR